MCTKKGKNEDFCNYSGCQVHGSSFKVNRFAVFSYLLGNIELACDLYAIAPDVMQEPDELCIRFRIEPVFHQSNP
ncbi:hypothetical protein ACFL9T_21815, partial [Thermodesulfobacteriota bacterium]